MTERAPEPLGNSEREELEALRKEKVEDLVRFIRNTEIPTALHFLDTGFHRTLHLGQEMGDFWNARGTIPNLSASLNAGKIQNELSATQRTHIEMWLKDFDKVVNEWRHKTFAFFVYRKEDLRESENEANQKKEERKQDPAPEEVLSLKDQTTALFRRLIEADLKGEILPQQSDLIKEWYAPAAASIEKIDKTLREIITVRHPMLLRVRSEVKAFGKKIEENKPTSYEEARALQKELLEIARPLFEVTQWPETQDEFQQRERARRNSGQW